MDSSPQPESRLQSDISCTVLLNIFWFIVMVSAIGLGAAHLTQCPIQPYIPIYLVVLGTASPFSLALACLRSFYDSGLIYILATACMHFLHFFSFCWIIAGSVWVYPIYPPNYLRGERYCQKTTYQFAFVITTIVWVILCLSLLCGVTFSLLTCCETFSARRRLIPNRNTFYGGTNEQPPAGDV